jgi:transposase
VVIALMVTPDGFPLAYEVLPGNTLDKQTLTDFLAKIEAQYGKADRVWVMDRGIPTEETLAQMRAADPPVHYPNGPGRISGIFLEFVRPPYPDHRDQGP